MPSSSAAERAWGPSPTMARQADPTIAPDAFDWVDQFDVFPIRDFYLDVVSLWAESLGQTVEVAEEKNA